MSTAIVIGLNFSVSPSVDKIFLAISISFGVQFSQREGAVPVTNTYSLAGHFLFHYEEDSYRNGKPALPNKKGPDSNFVRRAIVLLIVRYLRQSRRLDNVSPSKGLKEARQNSVFFMSSFERPKNGFFLRFFGIQAPGNLIGLLLNYDFCRVF